MRAVADSRGGAPLAGLDLHRQRRLSDLPQLCRAQVSCPSGPVLQRHDARSGHQVDLTLHAQHRTANTLLIALHPGEKDVVSATRLVALLHQNLQALVVHVVHPSKRRLYYGPQLRGDYFIRHANEVQVFQQAALGLLRQSAYLRLIKRYSEVPQRQFRG